MNRLSRTFVVAALLVAVPGCGDDAGEVASLTGLWGGVTEQMGTQAGLIMSIELVQAPDGSLSGGGDIRFTGGGGARAEVIEISEGAYRPPEATFVLTNGVLFFGDVDPAGPSVHFRIVPRADRRYPPTITLHPAR